MRELLRTSDPVLVSFVDALLKEAGFTYHVADVNTSAVEGSIAIFPRRVLIMVEQEPEARALLVDAGLTAELSEAKGVSGASPAWLSPRVEPRRP